MLTIVLALIMLTQLDGGPVWLETRQILFIRERSGACAEGTGAVIGVGTQFICVKETPGQIREKIREANGG